VLPLVVFDADDDDVAHGHKVHARVLVVLLRALEVNVHFACCMDPSRGQREGQRVLTDILAPDALRGMHCGHMCHEVRAIRARDVAPGMGAHAKS
jgi:hypothetical protein